MSECVCVCSEVDVRAIHVHVFGAPWCNTIIDFNFGRHDLSTRKSDIHRGRNAEVKITFKGR